MESNYIYYFLCACRPVTRLNFYCIDIISIILLTATQLMKFEAQHEKRLFFRPKIYLSLQFLFVVTFVSYLYPYAAIIKPYLMYNTW